MLRNWRKAFSQPEIQSRCQKPLCPTPNYKNCSPDEREGERNRSIGLGLILWPGDAAPGPLYAYLRFRGFVRIAGVFMSSAISIASFSRAIGSVRLCSQFSWRFFAAANNSGSTLAAWQAYDSLASVSLLTRTAA